MLETLWRVGQAMGVVWWRMREEEEIMGVEEGEGEARRGRGRGMGGGGWK